ncbi:hypothetical protein AAFF_G00187620 [Aldrovandia affinis]|uniref:Ig-like domain-containing protein n=1 Tax=Aldrovandia affinis TaxID=143900 RepID=A0AAD7WVR9_9TELE|nr:hypothetical protein AAFF_G00187620 [Aldrovandia affinis]
MWSSGMSGSARALDLSFSCITGVRQSDFLPRLPSTVRLNLSHNCIVEIQEAAFASFSNLEVLDLSSNCLRIVREGALQGLGHLKTLDLRNNRIAEVHRHAFIGLDALQTLWLQNNKLDTIPEAISGLADLCVLSLATNQISRVDSGSVRGCRGLTALHLQHNLISGVSVEAFWDLVKLQVLNLSANLLETMPGSALESLWGQGTEVCLHGNPWRCDCGLEELRRQAPAQLTGGVWCHGGALHGVPLSSLGPGQLVCSRTLKVSQTLTARVMEGRDLRLPCGNGSVRGEAQYWQTPFGRLENSSSQDSGDPVAILRDGSVKITRATPHHAGLYYCLLAAGEGRLILPYRVECVHSASSGALRPRKTRETEGYQETSVSGGHFVAAVTSSVVVTFLVGFALGAFSRTYLNRCRPFRRARQQEQPNGGGEDMDTLPSQYENMTFRKGPGPEDTASTEGTVTLTVQDAHFKRVLPDSSANPGRAYLDGSDSGDDGGESQGEKEAENGVAGNGEKSKRRDQGPRGEEPEGSSKETDPGRVSSARTSKSRVIKLYNYDEEGKKYGHVRESEDESAPRMKQRSLSLTRLNAIMSAATSPGFSKEPSQGDTTEQEKPADGPAIFQLSV